MQCTVPNTQQRVSVKVAILVFPEAIRALHILPRAPDCLPIKHHMRLEVIRTRVRKPTSRRGSIVRFPIIMTPLHMFQRDTAKINVNRKDRREF